MSLASEDLSDRVRDILAHHRTLTEKKMFGGRCFMLDGNMLVCPLKDGGLLVRVGKAGYDHSLTQPGAQPMMMGSRTMAGFIAVTGDVLEDDAVLVEWIERARAFVATLPAK